MCCGIALVDRDFQHAGGSDDRQDLAWSCFRVSCVQGANAQRAHMHVEFLRRHLDGFHVFGADIGDDVPKMIDVQYLAFKTALW